jgi:hypothetical protein
MNTLYSAYGRGLLKRLEAVDALMRSSPNFAAFVDKCNADLEPELHLKQLLIKPRQRVSEYYGGLRELRRLLAKKAPLEVRIRELLPLLRSVREASDAVGVDDSAAGKDDDVADAPPSPPPHERGAAPSLGPPPRIVPRSSSHALSPLGPPPPIVAGRGRRDSYTKRVGGDSGGVISTSTSNRETAKDNKDKDKKFALFGKTLGRKNEPVSPPTAAASHKMFGVPLMELAARERRAVPIFVSVLCNIIEAKGLAIEGIFRTNESKPVENAARERIERGDPPAQAAADPVVAASLIKSWLRELPDPLLTFASYDKFITVGQALGDSRATKLLFKQMINDLPPPHRACTNTLLNVCRFVMDNESVNKMSAKNLAIVLAPNILRPRADPHADHTKMVSEMQDAVNIVAAMISLHEKQTAESDTTTSVRAAAPVEHKLSGSPVIIGADPVAPDAALPPLDPLDGVTPPPPEPADDIVVPEPTPPAPDADAPPPPDAADGSPPPPAQRTPMMNMQQQRQRALASEMVARRQVARPSSGGGSAIVPPTRSLPPGTPSRRAPATTDSLNLSSLAGGAAPPAPPRSTLSPRASEDHRVAMPAPTTPAPTPSAAAPRSTEERIAHLESSNAALVALTARLEERIAQLELQLLSK